jgi:enoyl-CoA hydratase/carnithine racemase
MSNADLVQTQTKNGVTTITMDNPRRLNGWTADMMDTFKRALSEADADPNTGAIVFTGTGTYYSAGVNLSASLQLGHPAELHAFIIEHNEALFEAFLGVSKPILVAANGPAIGASVTSATLCDAIVASENATFSTPFARLGITPEGCSSVMFAALMGKTNAQRMLGPEGWVPTGAEAAEVGLVDEVVPHDQLMDRAQALAEGWVSEGRARSYRGGFTLDELRQVNARESKQLATAFLSQPFLRGQYEFLRS